ncbi:DUF1501 domain-containing protein [Vibrio sp. Of7-15]|uniref:DUF1501 domain-containing protein n=1 Tax=Vibrio sp. Of7-15 TaxID=2724879 RepID=UPI001EF36D79|nr:DUF1501 domain-containing protein [Vibrio sp. Of7-15]MCG7496542.1 DUF1501 domain-containing protein [Vibrio sp. Of7-15]
MVTRRQLLAAMAAAPFISMLDTRSSYALPANDYKALVCVFLFGGNDGFNMLVPRDNSHYDEYAAARPDIALPQADLLPLSLNTGSSLELGLHPSMAELQALVNAGKAVPIVNSGVLIEPATKAEFDSGAKTLPPFLFSHNSQQAEWQRGWAGNNTTLGWAGRMMDILAGREAAISPTFSINGYVQLLNGEQHTANLINSSGLPTLWANGNSARKSSFDQVLALQPDNTFGRAFDQVKKDSISIRDTLASALESSPEEGHFPDYRLSQQLHTVARLIKSSEQLGHQRQVYFVGMGGFDTHANQLSDHQTLLAELSQSLAAFQQSLDTAGIGGQVTTMTMSDFGRRLASNGAGTDHGWASNHWVMGGALNGRQMYGSWPSLILDGVNDFNKGRMIPTTSVEQVGATIARWMGVNSDSQLQQVFPNLANFTTKDLGFMG